MPQIAIAILESMCVASTRAAMTDWLGWGSRHAISLQAFVYKTHKSHALPKLVPFSIFARGRLARIRPKGSLGRARRANENSAAAISDAACLRGLSQTAARGHVASDEPPAHSRGTRASLFT
jgi:hypothetical protein